MSVVNFYEARKRLRPFGWASDWWLKAWITVAQREPKWRPALPDLRAEVKRRSDRRRRLS